MSIKKIHHYYWSCITNEFSVGKTGSIYFFSLFRSTHSFKGFYCGIFMVSNVGHQSDDVDVDISRKNGFYYVSY